MSDKNPTLTERVWQLELEMKKYEAMNVSMECFYRDARSEKDFRAGVQRELAVILSDWGWAAFPYILVLIVGIGIGAILITLTGGH